MQIRTHSIRKAHENIDKTLKAAEVILTQFDFARQVGALDNHFFCFCFLCTFLLSLIHKTLNTRFSLVVLTN